jgi:1,4-alpha-glucan branching enzyme
LYWVLDERLQELLRKAAGPVEARLDIARDGRSFSEAERLPIDLRAPGWYVAISQVDCLARVRLGVRRDGAFDLLLTSNSLRVPRLAAGTGAEMWRGAPAAPGAPAQPEAPGSLNVWEPGARAVAAPPAGGPVRGDLCLVLHCHLPFVRHPERRFFLEEHWLYEGITETYLPLLDMFEHLEEDGAEGSVTLSLTPTLVAMLRDPLLMERYEHHLERMCELARREVERTRRDPDFGPVTGFYHDRLERLHYLFVRTCGRDLVGRFAALEDKGRIEIIGCAATHGLLPHLAVAPECVRAQIEVGVAEHRRQFGRPPRGLWLPECGYFEGLDRELARAGIRYFFVDAHAFTSASSPPRRGLYAPLFCPAGPAAFARDQETGVQVWSAREGYPGDTVYRDFYRDIGFDLDLDYVGAWLDPAGVRHMTGFKYHRITGATDHKEPYRRDAALRAASRHADHFVGNRRLQLEHLARSADRRPLVVSMYDAELFGHWWFEGPEWLELVLRRLPAIGARATTPWRYLEENPSGQVAEPSTSSWGERGYYDVWLSGQNDWIVPPLHDAGRRMIALAAERGARQDPLARRALAQAGRELLLAQASDWPFILRQHTSTGYARRRVREHLERFDRLASGLEAGAPDAALVAELEQRDNLFPDLDPGAWRTA